MIEATVYPVYTSTKPPRSRSPGQRLWECAVTGTEIDQKSSLLTPASRSISRTTAMSVGT
jgi:hypothetical protein